MNRVLNLLKRKKDSLLKLGVLALIVVAITALTLFILYFADIITFDDGLTFNMELFDSFKGTWYGAIIIILLQTVLTMLLCFVPAISMAFILLIKALYPGVGHAVSSWSDFKSWIPAFLISFASVMLASAILYILGRIGGYKLCSKLLGNDDAEKALGLLRNNGTVYFPLMMMFPVFPDDALVMIAGTIKMKLSWFIPSIVIGRSIGIAMIVFGLSVIPFKEFALYDWLLFITMCVFWLIIILKSANKLNKKLAAKRAEEKSAEAEIQSTAEEAPVCEAASVGENNKNS